MTTKIVRLDSVHSPSPLFEVPNIEFVEYETTSPDQVAERTEDADIIITTRVRISADVIAACQKLKLIAVSAAGIEIIDLPACRAAQITVCNVPGSSNEAVADHAFALYFAVRRKVVELHKVTMQGVEWPRKGTAIHKFQGLPLTCSMEVMGIVGYGALGKRIEGIAKALGMSVLIAERKAKPEASIRPSRSSFPDTIRQSTVLVLCCPLNDSTRNMIGEEELKLMQPDAILINVARGGIVVESDLARALQEGLIKGAGIDVFEVEPGNSSTSALIAGDIPNLTVSPHVAWFARSSIKKLQSIVKENIEKFLAGIPLSQEYVVQR